MTDNEIIMLISGFVLGCYTMVAWHLILDMKDLRRSSAHAARARRRAAGEKFLSSFREYRLENRPPLPQPHPTEVVEATFRDFELKLYDGLDRIDSVLRREGL